MEVRTYTRKQVDDVVRRYWQGETDGSEVDLLAKSYAREHGVTEREGLRAVLRPPAEKYSQRETDAEKIRNASKELDGVARNIMRSGVVVFARGNVEVGRVDYAEALKLAIISNPILGAQYSGHEIRSDGEAFEHVKRVYADRAQSKRYQTNDVELVANVVSGLPKLSDGRIDWNAGVRAVTPYAIVAQQAAAAEIEHRANRKSQGNVTTDTARREVRRQFPALAALADSGTVTQQALKELLPQLVH